MAHVELLKRNVVSPLQRKTSKRNGKIERDIVGGQKSEGHGEKSNFSGISKKITCPKLLGMRRPHRN